MIKRRAARWIGAGLLAGVATVVGILLARAPSNDRDWAVDHARLAAITMVGDSVRIEDFRDFRHRADRTFETGYRTETFDLGRVERVWFALAPFANRYRGLAHSFVTFEFADDRFLGISIEARREAEESYSLLGGLLQAFEITYVIGSEEDLLGQRAVRGDTLFLYPSVATPDQSRALLRDMLDRASRTGEHPEFYNTLFNNCNTGLRDHVNRSTGANLPWGWGILLPGFSDGLALDEGLLDTDLNLEQARERYRVDERVRRALDEGGPGFGRRIRGDGG